MTEESVEDAMNRINGVVAAGTVVPEETIQLYLRMKNAVAEVNKTNQARIDELQAEVRQLTATRDALVATRNALNNETRNAPNNEINNENNSTNSPSNGDDKYRDFRGDLFKKSTHRYLFMDTITRPDGTSYEVSWYQTILALSVIAVQMFGYCFIAFSTLMKHGKERNSRRRPSSEIDPALVSVVIPVAGFVLFSFLLPDLFELFILLKCKGWKAKLTGVLILFKSVFVLIVGVLGGVCMPVIGARESFLLYVGLIFVHKVDGRIGYLQDMLKKAQEKFAFFYPIFGSIFVPFVLIFLTDRLKYL